MCRDKRPYKLQQYKHIQREITKRIDEERKEIMKQKLTRPYHHEVLKTDSLYQNDIYNALPTENEIIEAINNKSNGKSTTDVKNEMLKDRAKKWANFTAIDIAKTEKRPIYITFYDVSKAYDNADNIDMLKFFYLLN